MRLERSVEDAEPAGQVWLHRELLLQFGLELQLLRVVSLPVLARRDEGPERASLVAVDPVDRVLPPVELEHGGEELRPESLLLQALRHRMDRRHLILEVGITDDDPRVAEGVFAPLELRPGPAGNSVEELLQIVLSAHELTGRERLEDDPARAGTAQTELGVERHRRRRQREEPFSRRPGELFLAEQDVAQAHARATRPAGPFLGRSRPM